MSDSPKPWFVGHGVKLWRRSDFIPGGVPFRAFVADYRDGVVEAIGLDLVDPTSSNFEKLPPPGSRAWVPWQMLAYIEIVHNGELSTWQKECGIDLSHVGGPSLEDAHHRVILLGAGVDLVIDPDMPPGTFRIRQARSGSG